MFMSTFNFEGNVSKLDFNIVQNLWNGIAKHVGDRGSPSKREEDQNPVIFFIYKRAMGSSSWFIPGS